jgi:hypothetical protein
MAESTSNEENTLTISEKRAAIHRLRAAIHRLVKRLDKFEQLGFPDVHSDQQDSLWEQLKELENKLEQLGLLPGD